MEPEKTAARSGKSVSRTALRYFIVGGIIMIACLILLLCNTVDARNQEEYHETARNITRIVSEPQKAIGRNAKRVSARANTYKVIFHYGDQEASQIIKCDTDTPLDRVMFDNEGHEFFGWSASKNGLPSYSDGQVVNNLVDDGQAINLYAVYSGDGAKAAAAWAINIANDDSFNYGTGKECHRIGCYFCGTNQKKKPKGYEKTYVCLTFVGAAFAHGAEDPEILAADQAGKMSMYLNDNVFKFSCWEKVGQCKDLSMDDLQPGDVVIDWSSSNGNDGHAYIYLGGDQLVDAITEGWGPDSIAVRDGAASRLARYSKDSKNFVIRYNG